METALKFALKDKNYTFLARELLNYFEIEDFLAMSGEVTEHRINLEYTPDHGFSLGVVEGDEENAIAIPSDLLNEFVEEALADTYSEIHENEQENNVLSDFMNHLEECYACAEGYMRVKSGLVNKLPGLLTEFAMDIAEQAENILCDTNNYISDIHLSILNVVEEAIRIRFDIEIVSFEELITEDDFDGICDQIPELIISRLPQLLQEECKKSTGINEEFVNRMQVQWDSKVLWLLYQYMEVSLDEMDEFLEQRVVVSDDQENMINRTKMDEIIDEMGIFSVK